MILQYVNNKINTKQVNTSWTFSNALNFLRSEVYLSITIAGSLRETTRPALHLLLTLILPGGEGGGLFIPKIFLMAISSNLIVWNVWKCLRMFFFHYSTTYMGTKNMNFRILNPRKLIFFHISKFNPAAHREILTQKPPIRVGLNR